MSAWHLRKNLFSLLTIPGPIPRRTIPKGEWAIRQAAITYLYTTEDKNIERNCSYHGSGARLCRRVSVGLNVARGRAKISFIHTSSVHREVQYLGRGPKHIENHMRTAVKRALEKPTRRLFTFKGQPIPRQYMDRYRQRHPSLVKDDTSEPCRFNPRS